MVDTGAKETPLGLFMGTDKKYEFPVLNEAETAAIDVSSWSFSFMVKTSKEDADAAAILTKATGSGIAVSGVYNADPNTNLQRVVVTIQDTDTDGATPGTRYWELKRTNDGVETVLAFGEMKLRRGVHRT